MEEEGVVGDDGYGEIDRLLGDEATYANSPGYTSGPFDKRFL
jgi:hypothetical protein